MGSPESYDEVPEQIIDHGNPQDFAWVPVEVMITKGNVQLFSLLDHTAVARNNTAEFARGAVIEDEIVRRDDTDQKLSEGETVTVYYRVDTGTEGWTWQWEQLDATYDELTVTES